MKTPIMVMLSDLHLTDNTIDTFKSTLIQAAETAEKHQLKDVFLLGDVFHSRKSQSLACLLCFMEVLHYYRDADITLVCLTGNHDKVNLSGKESFISIFKQHKYLWLIEDYSPYLPSRKCPFYMSFLSYFPVEKQREILNEIKNTETYGKKSILLTHADIVGGRMNGGKRNETGLTLDDLSCFDKVYSGHYHDPSDVQGKIHYIGAAYQHDFGENQNKGITVLYYDEAANEPFITERITALSAPLFIQKIIHPQKLVEVTEIPDENKIKGDRFRLLIPCPIHEIPLYSDEIQRLKNLGYEINIESKENIVKLMADSESNYDKSIRELFDEYAKLNSLTPDDYHEYFNAIPN